MIETTINGIKLEFKTDRMLFSPKRIDKGTLAMLSVVEFAENDKVCDLGCGYGFVGVLAAKIIGANNVILLDNEQLAVDISKENALLNDLSSLKVYKSDGFNNIEDHDFTKIICHPPYHTDFSVPKTFIEKGFNRLTINGKMYMVTKRKEWYKNKLISIFGGVKIWEIDDYFVFMALKKSERYANIKPRKKRRNNYGTSNKKYFT
jgi:16S rRNA (guanine1207-N2)-methyltransferase